MWIFFILDVFVNSFTKKQIKTWRQRRAGMERRKKGLNPEDEEECDYAVSPANLHHYVPPTFAGSLGKPTLSTVNYPRHVSLF